MGFACVMYYEHFVEHEVLGIHLAYLTPAALIHLSGRMNIYIWKEPGHWQPLSCPSYPELFRPEWFIWKNCDVCVLNVENAVIIFGNKTAFYSCSYCCYSCNDNHRVMKHRKYEQWASMLLIYHEILLKLSLLSISISLYKSFWNLGLHRMHVLVDSRRRNQ